MGRPSGQSFFRRALAVLAAALLAGELQAADWPAFRVAGTGGGKRPFVVLDGGEILTPGETSARGVEVVSVATGSAVLRWKGEERTFRAGDASPSGAGDASPPDAGAKSVRSREGPRPAPVAEPRRPASAATTRRPAASPAKPHAAARKARPSTSPSDERLRRIGAAVGRMSGGRLVLGCFVLLFFLSRRRSGMTPVSAPPPPRRRRASPWFAEPRDEGFEEHRGLILAVLPEDTIGIRHQRLLVRTEKHAKVLLVHNIDLCPRIVGLEAGREIRFYGQFTPNDRGGVFHRLHRNSNPFRPWVDGWIEYGDHRYS